MSTCVCTVDMYKLHHAYYLYTHTNIYFQTWRGQDLLFLDTIKVIANRVADLTIVKIVYDTGKVADFLEMSKTFVIRMFCFFH